MSAASKPLATAETLRALGDERYEVIAGELIRKADPTGEHGDAQSWLPAILKPPFQRRTGGPDGPGGWWIATEVDVELGLHDIVRPDVSGWRRERVPERPVGHPVRHRPDWICEVLSPGNLRHDVVVKHELYRRYGVPHYWIVDPQGATLTVYRLTADGALVAGRDAVVRAEPFEAIELRVGLLFGDE